MEWLLAEDSKLLVALGWLVVMALLFGTLGLVARRRDRLAHRAVVEGQRVAQMEEQTRLLREAVHNMQAVHRLLDRKDHSHAD